MNINHNQSTCNFQTRMSSTSRHRITKTDYNTVPEETHKICNQLLDYDRFRNRVATKIKFSRRQFVKMILIFNANKMIICYENPIFYCTLYKISNKLTRNHATKNT